MKKNKKLVMLSSVLTITTLASSFSLIENSIKESNKHNLFNFTSNNLAQTQIPEAELSIDEYGVQKLFINYQGIRYGIKYINNEMGNEIIVDGISRQTLKYVNDLIVIQDNLTFLWNNQKYDFEVKKIKEKAFKGDDYGDLTIVIGNKIKEIGDQTFQSSKFKKIVFPGNDRIIFSNTLANAQYIKNIDRFGISAFNNTTGLPKILIFDNSIKEINSKAFSSVKYDDITRSISYYSYKTKVDSNAFDSNFSIKVEPTKFKDLKFQIQHDNIKYQQIKIDDLSQKSEFQDESYLKEYIIKNISTIFENFPIKINPITSEKSNDLLKENIFFDLEISNNNREIYLKNLSLDYWYDENGNIIQNKKQSFGNLALTQTIKKTDIKNPISALDLGLENKTAQQASNIINNEFIFNKIDKFLIGDYKISDATQIKNVLNKVENNQIKLSFSLSNNTWYNEEGILVDEEKQLNTIITNFLVKAPTKINDPIDANNLGIGSYTAIQAKDKVNSNLLFDYRGVIFNGDEEISSSSDFESLNVTVENKNLKVIFSLKENVWYDEQGLLGTTKKQFETTINNFFKYKETKIINPIKASSIGLASNTIEEALEKIDNKLIYSKLSNFFEGNYNIQKLDDIEIISKEIKNQKIELKIKLSNNTWYNFDGDLVNSEKTFTTIIDGFQRKNETKVINPIEASSLGWKDLTAIQAKPKLNNEFIFQNKEQFLIGDFLLSSDSNIEVVDISILNNEINLTFKLSRGVWYDEEGRLGKDEKEFQTLIHHFKNEVIHNETRIISPIDASTINLNTKTINEALNLINENFIFSNLSKFFTGSHEIDSTSKIDIISKTINSKKIDLKIELSENTVYDKSGNLIESKKTFNTLIYNFKQEVQYQETKIKNPIQALNLNLNDISAKDAQNKITEQFILNHKNEFFFGYLNLNNIDEMLELSVAVSNNDLIVTLKLKSNTWANENGQIGNFDKLFSTKIVGFKQEIDKQKTQINKPIEANLIGLGNKTIEEANSLISSDYIFEFISIFFRGDYEINNASNINIIEKSINENKIVLTIELSENTCYDDQNSLINTKVKFSTEIVNFKQEIVKQETQINKPIEASNLWKNNILINEAINQINSDFIFTNILIFFKGDNEIRNSSQIIVNKKIVNKEIHLEIQLAANTWYDANNGLGKKPKTFLTTIINFENEQIEVKKETKIINPINAQNLNWSNLTAEEAGAELTNNFIYMNKNKFLSGDHLLTSEENIRILDIRISNNEIIFSLSLSSGTWYDSNNQLGRFDKTFSTIIQNFKKNEIKEETKIIKPIDAITINLNNKTINESFILINESFIFNNLNKFFNGNYEINNVSKIRISKKIIDKVQNRINLEIELSENSAYDAEANLINKKIKFETYIFNFKPESQYEETKIIDLIQASNLGLNNLNVQEAQKMITTHFILNNKNNFFTGYLNLQNENEIVDLNVSISNNDLIVTLKLKANTWADKNGQIGTFDKLFSTKITNFKETEIKQETKIKNPIKASSIGLENKTIDEAITLINKEFIFANIANILSGSYEINSLEKIIDVSTEIQLDKIKLVLKFDRNTCYDDNNSLIDNLKTFETFIVDFKTLKKQETVIINIIQAHDIGLDLLTAEKALEKINSQFVFEKKDKFFKGDNEIKSSNQINILTRLNQDDDSISLTITLSSGTTYDSQGNLIQKSKNFETKIVGFKHLEKPEQKQKTEIIIPIYAKSINLNSFIAIEAINQIDNNFIYKYINQFFKGNNNVTNESNITIIDSNVSNNEINLTIKLSVGTWYDDQGNLGQIDKLFSTKIIDFKEEIVKKQTQIISPIEAKKIGLNTSTINEALLKINEELIFNNLNSFFSGNHEIKNVSNIKIISKNIIDGRIKLDIQLANGVSYDENGHLNNFETNFETYIFNFKPESQYEETKIINLIQASNLKLNNLNAQEAQKMITTQFILNNKNKFFIGYLNLQNENEIVDLNVSISNNDLIVTLKLKANTWADKNGQIGTFDKLFSTKITNFKETVIKQETKINKLIEASSINLGNKTIDEAITLINKEFIFANIANILSGSHEVLSSTKIESVVKNIEGNNIKLTITFAANTCYDSNGYLISSSKTFETLVINFAQNIINKPTIIKSPIEAIKINLNNFTIYEAIKKIDNNLIFQNLNIFFEGDHKINQSNQINVEKQIVKNKIILNITLASDAYYDEYGKLGQVSKTFATEIINFKLEEQKKETIIKNSIEASALDLNTLTADQALLKINANLIFEYKNKFFEGDNNISSHENIIRIETTISNNTISLSFYLVSLTWYDENGKLGDKEKLFETKIVNFKKETSHKPTLINSSIDAIKINLENQTIKDALKLIDNNFIFKNINKFFEGDYEINSSSQIYINSKIIVDDKIKLVISLGPKSYYDEYGKLGDKEKLFTTFIFNFKKENQKQETKIIKQIEALKIGLNIYTAEEAVNKITNDFIYKNKSKFFEGYLNLSNSNDIFDLLVKVSNNELNVSFKLKENTWSDKDGNVGTISKSFTTSIIKFKESQIKKETKINSIIKASLISLNNLTVDEAFKLEFKNIVFDKKTIFFEGDYEISSIQNIVKIDKLKEGNKLKLSITLAENTWYDKNGKLVNKIKTFETEIIDFKQNEIKKAETIINSPIEALKIGLGDKYISDAINLINSEFVFKNIKEFFKGDLNISKTNQINIYKKQKKENTIVLTIVLASNTWYNQNGVLENRTKSFETIIKNFKNDKKQETKIVDQIQAFSLDLEYLTIEEAIKVVDSSLIYKNREIFFSGDYEINLDSIEIFSKNIVKGAIEISIILKENTCYDKNGNLIVDRITKFETKIIGFKESPKITKTYVINPINASSIGLSDKLVKDVINENIISSEFIFNNKNKFIGGSNQVKYSSYISINKVEQVGNRKIKLSFTLSANSWYDENGKLSESSITFETMIVKFKVDKDLPIDSDEYNNVPWTKWWNITLLCLTAAIFSLLVIRIIRKIYKIKSRK